LQLCGTHRPKGSDQILFGFQIFEMIILDFEANDGNNLNHVFRLRNYDR
jgi:hypothetical protein